MIPALLLSLTCLSTVVLLLLYQIKTLKKHLTYLSPIEQSQNFELIEHFPQPICIANSSGKILFLNSHWRALHSTLRDLSSLADFDRFAGTRLNGRLTHAAGHRTFNVTLPISSDSQPQSSYSAVTWPLNIRIASSSIALVLFPQQLSQAREQEFPRLERELLANGRQAIGKAMEALRAQRINDATLHLLGLAELFGYVSTHHKTLRTRQPTEIVDISSMWREALTHARRSLREKGVLVTGTLSHDSDAVAARQDLQLFFSTLLEYLSQGSGTEIRIHQQRSHITQTVEIETDIITPGDSLQEIRLRLLHQLAVKMGGHFQASGAPHPRYRLRLPAPIPEELPTKERVA